MLHYRLFRSNPSQPWVTLIHGAGGSSSIWYKQLKEYRKSFNVLSIDLRGHGRSQKDIWKKNDSFVNVATDVIEVLDHLQIKTSHFIGISLGTIVIQTIVQAYPERVSSQILGGAVIKLDIRTKLLVMIANIVKHIVPYMLLYKLYAWILMPNENHKESRLAFITQAKKMCQKEFIRWFALTKSINPYLCSLQLKVNNIPTLFVMGAEDYLFLAPVKELVQKQPDLQLITIENSGHVCNIDQPEIFNKVTVQFIQQTHRLLPETQVQ
ncbi:alpha/beta hydrolase [Bacillus sp. FJAT-50079]|uniref:alpha/beta fold hydrolase n=1 Tax=Bacillus sp. FJAT-50079 TaxID=2833577 RepID=UPI001BC9501C|nr:alpha/beta hydrolase [Bacillus sp. FJAT-50079]MBS4208622.1 alpha/beta hydrolase [Bacillus sp. FJAT-50079]